MAQFMDKAVQTSDGHTTFYAFFCHSIGFVPSINFKKGIFARDIL